MKKRNSKSGYKGMESLETRLCYAATVYDSTTHTITITGTDGVDNVTFVDMAGGADRFHILGTDWTLQTGNSGLVQRVVVDLKGGDDTFELRSEADSVSYYKKDFQVNLGNGNNYARFALGNTKFGAFEENSIYGSWNINLTTGTGRDDVTADLGRRISGTTTFNARLGDGADFFTGSITGNTDDGLTRMHVEGDSGNDLLTGSVAADYFYGANGNDTITGGAGNDTLVGGAQNDSIRGGEGNDSLVGQSGLDQLFGEAGNDSLDGNGGGTDTSQDILSGGTGRDSFRQYASASGIFNQDLLVDLEAGEYVMGASKTNSNTGFGPSI